MASTASEHWRDEKINGIVYDMSPTPGYRHGIINGNIYTIIKQGLKNSICLVTIENLNFKYHPDVNDDYLCPDIMVICDRKHLKGGSYSGLPRFIAETLSPSTAKKTGRKRWIFMKPPVWRSIGSFHRREDPLKYTTSKTANIS